MFVHSHIFISNMVINVTNYSLITSPVVIELA